MLDNTEEALDGWMDGWMDGLGGRIYDALYSYPHSHSINRLPTNRWMADGRKTVPCTKTGTKLVRNYRNSSIFAGWLVGCLQISICDRRINSLTENLLSVFCITTVQRL